VDHAVSSHYDSRMNLQAEFLGLAQALEIFDRRQRGGKYEFKHRLENLFDGLSEQTRDRIGGKPEDFVRTVEDTRNYLVHYDERPERKVLHGAKEYFEANRKLRALLFVLLCKMLGISEDVALIGAFAPGGVLWSTVGTLSQRFHSPPITCHLLVAAELRTSLRCG